MAQNPTSVWLKPSSIWGENLSKRCWYKVELALILPPVSAQYLKVALVHNWLNVINVSSTLIDVDSALLLNIVPTGTLNQHWFNITRATLHHRDPPSSSSLSSHISHVEVGAVGWRDAIRDPLVSHIRLWEDQPADLHYGPTHGDQACLPELLDGGTVDLPAPETWTNTPYLLLIGKDINKVRLILYSTKHTTNAQCKNSVILIFVLGHVLSCSVHNIIVLVKKWDLQNMFAMFLWNQPRDNLFNSNPLLYKSLFYFISHFYIILRFIITFIYFCL